ncbi:hypothetical protein AVEN_203097-1 [Araneus ventricosus]|uniref:Retrotransposon gag domain-containing protein n=1 Tax=Araneus ventricosus TaxID=182803 RepID=A0A4Y2DRN2_ARAVE|nr:hypothetical protein AVEN_203097-1 [Araneus ventricosus]
MNVHGIPPPEAMKLAGNVVEKWNFFKVNWKNYSVVTELNEKDEKIKAALLFIIGRDTIRIHQHLDISPEERKDSSVIIEALSKYFKPAINVIYERSILNAAVQEDDESIEQYICRLRKLTSTCNYQNMLEELIRDRFLLSIQDLNNNKQLISDSKLTLQKAVDICKINESAN